MPVRARTIKLKSLTAKNGARAVPRPAARPIANRTVGPQLLVPLYAYIRRRGFSLEDAQDLTQEFFARLLRKNYPAQADRAKGKFRSFLLITLNHFLADEFDRASTLKRGGGQVFISLDQDLAEGRYLREPQDNLSPEKLFERRWAQTILENDLKRLRAEYEADSQPET